jgi:hypothetical protein
MIISIQDIQRKFDNHEPIDRKYFLDFCIRGTRKEDQKALRDYDSYLNKLGIKVGLQGSTRQLYDMWIRDLQSRRLDVSRYAESIENTFTNIHMAVKRPIVSLDGIRTLTRSAAPLTSPSKPPTRRPSDVWDGQIITSTKSSLTASRLVGLQPQSGLYQSGSLSLKSSFGQFPPPAPPVSPTSSNQWRLQESGNERHRYPTMLLRPSPGVPPPTFASGTQAETLERSFISSLPSFDPYGLSVVSEPLPLRSRSALGRPKPFSEPLPKSTYLEADFGQGSFDQRSFGQGSFDQRSFGQSSLSGTLSFGSENMRSQDSQFARNPILPPTRSKSTKPVGSAQGSNLADGLRALINEEKRKQEERGLRR